MWILIFVLVLILFVLLIKKLNKNYFVLALCPRIRTNDGSPLEQRVCLIPGTTRFGNNCDVLGKTPESLFQFARGNAAYAKGKAYVMYFLHAPIYNVISAEDAEQVFQSQALISKSALYELLHPFLGEGLLTSSGQKWQFRRKTLTPAFHFNILQSFIEVFKEETYKLIETLNGKVEESFALGDVIPQFSLNSICETALGVKLDNIEGSVEYRKTIHQLELIFVQRLCNPLMYYTPIFFIWGEFQAHRAHLKIAHDFSSEIIEKKRVEFQKRRSEQGAETAVQEDIYGKKKRYAMLDTLLDAEAKGLIDHQGICDEVNTFMFEGYDTTSTCLIFALANLACRTDLQEKCHQEIENMADISQLTVFELNQLEYLECVIKETLRLYPSVPFLGRQCETETELNGVILPPKTEVHVHTYDIMRDARHFPDPLVFEPERFLPQNTVNRHPFAFVPFSAGPRNCIGQKFAILEVKMLLVAIIRNFVLSPVTNLEDIVFENGLVLRTQQQVKVKISRRV